jgi:hypothetical protein
MIITAYKTLTHQEVIIWANITEPKYTDKAIIYVNAIEKSKGNQSVTATKIAFASDLLSSNPECLELNEFLKKAQTYINSGEYEQASNILDSVIQGCKYLVSQSKLKDESPKGFTFSFDFGKNPYLKYVIGLFFVVMAGFVILTIQLKKSNEKES